MAKWIASKEVTHEIKQEIAVLGSRGEEWSIQLNLVSWNGAEPKYDIRPWNKDRSKCGTGVTLSDQEIVALGQALENNSFI